MTNGKHNFAFHYSLFVPTVACNFLPQNVNCDGMIEPELFCVFLTHLKYSGGLHNSFVCHTLLSVSFKGCKIILILVGQYYNTAIFFISLHRAS